MTTEYETATRNLADLQHRLAGIEAEISAAQTQHAEVGAAATALLDDPHASIEDVGGTARTLEKLHGERHTVRKAIDAAAKRVTTLADTRARQTAAKHGAAARAAGNGIIAAVLDLAAAVRRHQDVLARADDEGHGASNYLPPILPPSYFSVSDWINDGEHSPLAAWSKRERESLEAMRL